jgi:type II secretory ATPase GspE/PulE/Tfp pilus assembly ATPase PilB-like protein
MSAVHGTQQNPGLLDDVNKRLEFFKRLQSVTNKIHSTSNVDEIMLDLSQDICDLFNCDRLTIYALSDDKQTIVSKVKTGLKTSKDLRLPVTEQSIAGYVALSKRVVNVRDVYDEAELKSHSQNLHFLSEVDRRTGYRTKQMLVAPMVDAHSRELLGVVQLINHRTGEPFTAVTEEGIKELCATLAIAFAMRQRPLSIIRSKYEHLVKESVLSAAELEVATSSARRKSDDIEAILSTEFQVPLPTIGMALSKFFGTPYEPHKPDRIRPANLLKNIKRDYAEQNQWLPIEENEDGIVILATDPEQVRSARIITSIFPKTRLFYCVTTKREFRDTLDDFYGADADAGSVDELLQGMESEEEGQESDSAADEVEAAAENELVKLVNKIIIDAYNMGVSDIHIEPRPGKEKIGIRFRRDGSLEPYIEIPASYRAALVARIKIMCDLDISERRKPQDGKIKFKRFGPLDIELRVATIPSAGGVEDVVMRILAAGEPIPLDKLGVLPHNLERLKNVVSKPYGLFFVCGPTGSGKTTTLHSVLHFLNTPDTKIWTAEDPVEITQKGLRQVQVNRKAGLDFATVMRAFLRADPDVIMVGEMRDKETVSIGLEASLTGHLVFATLHTNSAPESVIRLLDMGMDPFNFADALLGVLAQRLAKRLCSTCKQAYEPSPEELQMLLREYTEELKHTPSFANDPTAAQQAILDTWKKNYGDAQGNLRLYKPVGCNTCNNSGYKGRVGLHELMVGSDQLKKLIQEHARVAEMLACALEDGMLTLKMDGIEKVLAGTTDMKQVRVVCIK